MKPQLFTQFFLLLVFTHVSVCTESNFICLVSDLHTQDLFVKLSVLLLSVLSVPLVRFIPGYFPIQMFYPCWEHVSLLLPLTPSSSPTGCLMAPSTMCCMKALVSISIMVTNSTPVRSLGDLWEFVSSCT